MTNIELLQRRAIEIVTDHLKSATLCDDDYSYTQASKRLKLATDWHHSNYSLQPVMREIYFFELAGMLDDVEQIYPTKDEMFECKSEDLLYEFEAIEAATDNPFIAPVLLLSAILLDWQAIALECQDLFFSPGLMGQFEQTIDAVDYYAERLEFAKEMAESDDF